MMLVLLMDPQMLCKEHELLLLLFLSFFLSFFFIFRFEQKMFPYKARAEQPDEEK